MPENRRQYVQLVLILLAVPTQYFLAQWYGANNNSIRIGNLHQMMDATKETFAQAKTLMLRLWYHFTGVAIFRIDLKTREKLKAKSFSTSTFPNGENVAKEMFKYRSDKGYFAQSTATRSPRPKTVKFRVGQVIKHNKFGYRGVIIGWDSHCKAPTNWINAIYGQDKSSLDMPHYLILADVRDRPGNHMTYVAQDKISSFTNVHIINPKVWDYFEFYDGAQFHTRPAVHQMYPHD